MSFDVGSSVRVLEPFADAFPGIYTIADEETLEGGIVCHLSGIEPAFDPRFLEEV